MWPAFQCEMRTSIPSNAQIKVHFYVLFPFAHVCLLTFLPLDVIENLENRYDYGYAMHGIYRRCLRNELKKKGAVLCKHDWINDEHTIYRFGSHNKHIF